jgi:hypothetical protein
MATGHNIKIHIDKQVVETAAASLTGSEIRALHTPPIGSDRSLFLTVPGPGDDQKIGDAQRVELKEGMHFFSVVSQITPGGASAPTVEEKDVEGLLLESDVAWLNDKGFVWRVTPNPSGGGWPVISGYRVNSRRYDRGDIELLLVIPKGYNDTPLDMWWVSPTLRLRGSGAFPAAADVMQEILGKSWQRFSRHLTQPWRSGLDDVRGFMTYVAEELQSGE